MEIVNNLNKMMNDFYKAWEFENTEEQFISLNGELETTQEMKANIERFQSMTNDIENLINDENNFELIVESWDAVDQRLLDILISTFEINIEKFSNYVSNNEVRKEIKEFIFN